MNPRIPQLVMVLCTSIKSEREVSNMAIMFTPLHSSMNHELLEEYVLVLCGQTAFSLLCWVGGKGSGYSSIEILCDRIARNWRVLTKR